MFLGEYERTLDEKCRLTVPCELRHGLTSGAVLARSFDNCLCIYPNSEWERVARAIEDLPEIRFESREIAREIYSGAAACSLDRQGRVTIPVYLRERAQLAEHVVVAGVGRRVEIWSREAWLERRDNFETERTRRAEMLSISAV